jgi:hypothetical protein
MKTSPLKLIKFSSILILGTQLSGCGLAGLNDRSYSWQQDEWFHVQVTFLESSDEINEASLEVTGNAGAFGSSSISVQTAEETRLHSFTVGVDSSQLVTSDKLLIDSDEAENWQFEIEFSNEEDNTTVESFQESGCSSQPFTVGTKTVDFTIRITNQMHPEISATIRGVVTETLDRPTCYDEPDFVP